MNQESIKNDRTDNKVMMELLPFRELEEIARVYTAGAKKYGPNRWQNLPDGYQRYKGALLRHLTELEKGNDIDEDTGCMHAAQIAWNAIAMLHFKMNEMENKNVMILSEEEKKDTHKSFFRNVGETFFFEGDILKVKNATDKCIGCYFLCRDCLGEAINIIGQCKKDQRNDKIDVIFVKEE